MKVVPGIGPLWGELEATCPTDPEKGGWLLSPSHHLFESLLTISFGWYIFRHSYRTFRCKLKQMTIIVPPFKRTIQAWMMDIILFIALLSSLLLIIYHKYHGHKIAFLLQPCHMLHAFLLLLFFVRRGSGTGAILFSIYLHLLFAPFLGMVAADRSCYKQPYELENWAFQHAMLLIVPFVWIGTSRFPLYTGLSFFLLSFSTLLLFHFLILVPMSLITGCNLNYVLCPPVTVPPLIWLGRWYRPFTTLGCALLAWITRYVVIEGFIRIIGSKAREAEIEAERTKRQQRRQSRSRSASDADGSVKDKPVVSSGLTTPYADIELDEGVIVTNTLGEARAIQRANSRRRSRRVSIERRTDANPSSLERLASFKEILQNDR